MTIRTKQTLTIIAAALLFALLAILLTWPQLPHAATSVPDTGDPLEGVWTLRWIASRFPFDLGSVYDAPIFAGYPLTLAYDDTNLAQGAVEWLLILLTNNPLLSYNLIMVGSFAANALAVFLLARYVTRSTVGGIVAGAGVAFATYFLAHISHVNLVSFYPLPLALLALHYWLDHAGARRFGPPLLFTAAMLLQALSSFYYLAYLCIAVAVVVAWWAIAVRGWRGWDRSRLLTFVGQWVVVGLIIGAALLVLTAPYREINRTLGFARTQQEQAVGAAQPLDYLSVSPRNRVYGARLPQTWPEPLFPGFLLLALAATGLGLAALNRRKQADSARRTNPRWLLCYFWIGLAGLLLSFGPTLTLGDLSLPMPFRLLDLVPGTAALRITARFATLVLLGLGLLGGWAAGRLAAALPWRVLRAPLVLLLVAIIAIEHLSVPQPSVDVSVVPQAYHWLAAQPAGVLTEFPMSLGLPDAAVDSEREYFQGVHNHPLLNGHASFLPPGYREIALALDGAILQKGGRLQFTPANVGILQSLGVRYVMFDRTLKVYKKADWTGIQGNIATYPEMQLAAQFDDDWLYSVYTLQPLAAQDHLSLRYDAPPNISAGQPFSLTITIGNSYKYPLLARLQPQLQLRADWLDGSGKAVSGANLTLTVPLTLEPGDHSFPVDLRAPEQAGKYTLRLQAVASASEYRQLAPAAITVTTP